MEILESIDDLESVALDFKFVKALPSLEKLIHTLVVAQLKQNVDIFTILEEVHELGDVCVFD